MIRKTKKGEKNKKKEDHNPHPHLKVIAEIEPILIRERHKHPVLLVALLTALSLNRNLLSALQRGTHVAIRGGVSPTGEVQARPPRRVGILVLLNGRRRDILVVGETIQLAGPGLAIAGHFKFILALSYSATPHESAVLCAFGDFVEDDKVGSHYGLVLGLQEVDVFGFVFRLVILEGINVVGGGAGHVVCREGFNCGVWRRLVGVAWIFVEASIVLEAFVV